MPVAFYHAQHGEDQWIRENLPLPEKGIFVDVGSHNGVHLSNTLHFEQNGWTGICIEADPRQQEALVKNRPNSICVAAAVGTVTGHRTFHLHKQAGYSGLARHGGTPIRVEGKTLSRILDDHRIFGFDLLSIDTEGTELGVWKSLNRGRWPRIVIIEHDTAGMPNQKQLILSTFRQTGYELKHATVGNYIYVKKGA